MVKGLKVLNAERSWQTWRELAESQIQTEANFKEDGVEVAIKHPISGGIAKNEALSVLSRGVELFMLVLVRWRLRFPFEFVLPFSELLVEELVRR